MEKAPGARRLLELAVAQQHVNYLDRLARLARRVRFEDLSDSAIVAAKAVVLDLELVEDLEAETVAIERDAGGQFVGEAYDTEVGIHGSLLDTLRTV